MSNQRTGLAFQFRTGVDTSGKGPEIPRGTWGKFCGWRREAGGVRGRWPEPRVMVDFGTGLYWREQTEAFKVPSFQFTPLGFSLHCNYSKADARKRNEIEAHEESL